MMVPSLSFVCELLLIPALAQQVLGKTYTFPNTVYDGSVNVEFTSGATSLDGPKISPQINDTTYEWYLLCPFTSRCP
jgi:hypothetical protein